MTSSRNNAGENSRDPDEQRFVPLSDKQQEELWTGLPLMDTRGKDGKRPPYRNHIPDDLYHGPSPQQKDILDLVRDCIIIYSLQGSILYWNPAAERLYGWSPSDVKGMDPHALLRTRMSKPIREVYRQLLREGHWEGELTHTRRDGKAIVVDSRWALLKGPDHKPHGVLEINTDITPRKQAQRKLQAEWHRFASVLGMLPGYVAMKDIQGQIRFANRKFFDLYGTPGGRPSWQIQPDRTEKGEKRMIEQVLSEQITQAWEQEMPGGQIYHVAVCPFVDTDSTPVVLEMGIDVTQRMQAERQIARISEQQRRSIGQDLHDSVGQKLAGLRFLLQALVQRVGEDLPEQAPLAGKAEEVLQDALAQVRALARSLDPLGLEGDEICDLLHQLAKDTQKLFDVQCQVKCPQGLAPNTSQELQLYRIAQEAVGNAVRRRHARKISITVASGNDGIILTVEDDGIGIDDQGRKQEMFALQTMRHRVSGLGGTVRFESQDDKATVLRCRMPFASEHSGEEDGFNR